MSHQTSPQDAADKVKEAARSVADSARNEVHDAADQAGTALGRVSDKIRDLSSTAGERLHDGTIAARKKLQEGACVAREKLHDGALAARDKGGEAYDRVKDAIRENPIPAVIGFTALGFALAYAFFPRRERSLNLSDRLSDVLSPLGERLHDHYDSARSRGAELLEEMESRLPRNPVNSVLGQVRGFGKNLKFW